MVEQGHLTAGHARALLPIKHQRQQLDLANEAVARQLSVRDVESRAREISGGAGSQKQQKSASRTQRPIQPSSDDPTVRRIEEHLRKRLQTDVSIQQTGNERGILRISFYSHDDLERVLDLVLGKARSDFD